MCEANSLLSTPGISKSAAAEPLFAQCWLLLELPMSLQSLGLLNPDVILRGN